MIPIGEVRRSIFTRDLYAVLAIDGDEVELRKLDDPLAFRVHRETLRMLFAWVDPRRLKRRRRPPRVTRTRTKGGVL